MNLLVLDQFSEPGGAQQCLFDILLEIRSRGWGALVGLPGDGEMFDRVRSVGFETARIACGPYRSGGKSVADAGRFLLQLPLLRGQIRSLAGRVRADLIYVNGPRLLPSMGPGLPLVFHAHSHIAPGWARDLAGHALRRASAHVIANCEFVAAGWRRFVAAERVSVVYNGVSGPDGASFASQPTAGAVLGCIGRIAPEKGQFEFLKAAEIIHRACPDARFEIVGTALFRGTAVAQYERAVRAAAARLPVSFRGWITDVYTAFAGIDLLLVPSTSQEATTRVILEAHAAGVPVIAFRSGGIAEVLQDGIDGHLVESIPEMARLAIRLIQNPAARAGFAESGREAWQQRFTLERFRHEILSVLERAAATGKSLRQPAPAPPRPPESRRSRIA